MIMMMIIIITITIIIIIIIIAASPKQYVSLIIISKHIINVTLFSYEVTRHLYNSIYS